MLKLNLGAGPTEIPGYTAIDAKQGKSAYPLDCEDNSLDEIRASHILEHFPHKETLKVLRHWASKLKDGGVLKVAVPDFRRIVEPYRAGKSGNFAKYLMGGQVDENDFHKSLFDQEALYDFMASAGLFNITRWKSEVNDCASLPISLNLQGTKGEKDIVCRVPQNEKAKIVAVVTMGRLCWSDNMWTAVEACYSLGITIERGTGVFWEQILSRMMARHLNDGTEWILTLDGDSMFGRNHIVRLCQLLKEYPEVDALVPIQIKREQDIPLIGMGGHDGSEKVQIDINEFDRPLTSVATGHFGLTAFRVSALKKMPLPWLWGQPAPDGSWGDERTDPDIYFWKKFADTGLKAYLANDVKIGHLQVICTFPGRIKDGFKPIHTYITDLQNKGYPAHCVPKIRYKL